MQQADDDDAGVGSFKNDNNFLSFITTWLILQCAQVRYTEDMHIFTASAVVLLAFSL